MSTTSSTPNDSRPGAGANAAQLEAHPALSFGGELTEHCLVQRYRAGAWGKARIERHGRLELALQTRALHYAQSVFEGFKAHRHPDGGVALFRAGAHLERFRSSAARMCLPPVELESALAGVRELVSLDRAAVPSPPDSLYVRPLLFADDEDLISGASSGATLLVLLAPVPAFFGDSAGLRLRTETRYVRAFPGGTGAVKAAGNYAAAMLATRLAQAEGYHEVVWLDALERAYVEETGAMNLFVVRDGVLCTPPAGDTVLPGITRDSLLQLACDHGIPTREERIPIDASWWGEVQEVFSSGTAVGCTPIASIDHEGQGLFRRASAGPVHALLSSALMDVKEGRAADPHGWRSDC